MNTIRRSPSGQAMAPEPVKLTEQAFENHDNTEITWLSGAAVLINSHGTDLMIDPLLEGFDMPLLIEAPCTAKDVEHLDAVLITHYDNDHYSRETLKKLGGKVTSYHAPEFVAGTMERECGVSGIGHAIGDTFTVGCITCTLTPAWHNWQNGSVKYQYRVWEKEDYCGFWMKTPDGTIWLPGDSKLLEEHLHMPNPDVILFDFADNPWHITFEGAVQLANTYPEADLVLIHWGTVDAPDQTPFNADPEQFAREIVNPERIQVLQPGKPFILSRKP